MFLFDENLTEYGGKEMTKWEGLLPIGSVVILNNGEKKLMIVGQSQTPAGEPDKIFDYSAVLYPQGFYDRNNTYLFKQSFDIHGLFFISKSCFYTRFCSNFEKIQEKHI